MFVQFLTAGLVAGVVVEVFERFTNRQTAWILAGLIMLSAVMAQPNTVATVSGLVLRLTGRTREVSKRWQPMSRETAYRKAYSSFQRQRRRKIEEGRK